MGRGHGALDQCVLLPSEKLAEPHEAVMMDHIIGAQNHIKTTSQLQRSQSVDPMSCTVKVGT